MKRLSRIRSVLLPVAALFVVGLANHVRSQEQSGEERPEEPAPASPTPEQVKAWMESVTPGEPHRRLEAQTGDYTVEGRTWANAKAPPMELKGTASIRMILGGRYQALEFKGDTMGMPFEGAGLTGFDNVSKEYVSTWVDTMRTGILVYRGTSDGKGVVTMTCEIDDPMNPAVKCTGRQVVRSADGDHFSTETWVKRADEPVEFKAAEMSFARKQ